MFKRLFSIFLILGIVISVTFCVPVYVEAIPSNLAADYVPSGELKGNMINPDWKPEANSGSGYVSKWQDRSDWNAIETPDGGTLDITDGNWYGFMAQQALGNPRDLDNTGTLNYQNAPLVGTNIGFTKPVSGTTGNVVFSLQVTKDGSTESKVSIARRYNTGEPANPKGIEYSVEYPTCGDSLTLTKGVISELKGMFLQVGANSGADYGAYSIGFPAGSVTGARFIFNKATAYLGYEYAYDIAVSAVDTRLYYNKTITLDADVLNQIGENGGLNQNIIWYAMDKDRKQIVNGFTFIKNANGRTTVHIDKTVGIGTYTLVAVAEANEELVKGIIVSVFPENLTTDYVPDAITGNMIKSDWVPGTNFNQHNTGGSGPEASVTDLGNGEYRIMAMRNLGHPRAVYSNGVATGEKAYNKLYPISGAGISFTKPVTTTKGNVVFSFQVKTDSNHPNYGEQKIQVARARYDKINVSGYENDTTCNEYPTEFPGAEQGMKLKTNEYTTFRGMFVDAADADSDDYGYYAIGLPQGTLKDARAIIKTDNAYLGYEYAYDIVVSASSTQMHAYSEITVDADIVNQIGTVGSLNQDVTWYVLNSDRTNFADGFTITKADDGKAHVTVDETAALGTYSLVAVADNNSEMVKSIAVTVTDIAGMFEDYVPGEVTGNLAVSKDSDGKELFVAKEPRIPFDIDVETKYSGTDNEVWAVFTREDIEEKLIMEANGSFYYGYGAAGLVVNKNCYPANQILAEGKSIVFGAKVRSAGGTPTVQLALAKNWAKPTYSIEYPNGLKLNDREWHNFNATVTVPEGSSSNIHFGYGYTGIIDECERRFEIRKNSVYIGEEYAYDIVVDSDVKFSKPGRVSTFNVSAKIYNQVGNTGNLNQSVTWYALDEDRSEFVDKIEICENPNGSATVILGADVPEGSYNIVAVSDVYEGLQKGVTIKVGNTFEDYIPGKITGNLFIETADDFLASNGKPSGLTVSTTGSGDEEAWSIKTSYTNKKVPSSVIEVGGSSVGEGVGGTKINKSGYDAEKLLVAGKNIVIGAKVKKSASDVSDSTISAAMFQWGVKPTYPAEYPNYSDGFVVNSTNWQDFGATIHIPENGWMGSDNTNFYMGFVYNNDNNYKGYLVKKNSFYIGEEYAYDIKVSADSLNWERGKSTAINVNADILNQVGTKGYLDQNVTWHALNSIRTATVPGITITKNENGTATVVIEDSVPAGMYDIVAVSDVYQGFVKGVRITVDGGITGEKINVFDLTENNGTATFSASVVNTDASEIFFAVVSYDENGKLVKAETSSKLVDDGCAYVSYMSIDNILSGYQVKGFVWDNLTLRPIEFAEGIENTIITK